MSETFSYSAGEWAPGSGAKIATYHSKTLGMRDVVLIEWGDGDCCILRKHDDTTQCVTISKECMLELDKLRAQMPPGEVALAAAPPKKGKK